MILRDDVDLAEAIYSEHQPRYVFSAYYGPDLTEETLPVTEEAGEISFQGDQRVQGSGTIYVRGNTGGRSLVPSSLTDTLAPFGQEIQVSRIVAKGDREWSIPLGRYAIADVPSARNFTREFRSRNGERKRVPTGFDVQLKLQDRFDLIVASDFIYPEAPVSSSTWDELQRISPVPIVRSLPDVALPAGLVYGDSRMDAITTLAANLGGVPHMTRQGNLTVRVRDRYLTETVDDFTISGVIDLDDGLSNKLSNVAVVKSSTDATLLGVAMITSPYNPLRVNGPFGTRVARMSSPLLTTQAAIDAAAQTMLRRVSTRQARVARVTTLPDPRLEVGDYGTVIDPESGREISGEILAMRFPADPRAAMTLDLTIGEVRI